MTVKSILDEKGHDVVTVPTGATLVEAAAVLAERRIGAAVVVNEKMSITGILSERDIVRAVSQNGAAALNSSVADVMTRKVKTCQQSSTINEVMEIMTTGRFRHLPVEHEGQLDGIISIGDVVKRRIQEVEREADAIRSYIATA